MSSSTAKASAPGKVVLWGEYAVLAGAPAAVLAVDRRATCTVAPLDSPATRFSSAGFEGRPIEIEHLDTQQLPAHALIASHVARFAGLSLSGLHIHTDTSDFYDGTNKIGIGSSAAALVATYAALAAHAGASVELSQAIAAHQKFQGGGSGLDVACAVVGGCIRFRMGTAAPFELPPELQLRFYFTGASASSAEHVRRFSDWRGASRDTRVEALHAASEALFEAAGDAANWRQYVHALKALDESGSLGIYTHQHRALDAAAAELGLIYKPCGAGGGDIGVVVAPGNAAHALTAFDQRAQAIQCRVMNLQQDPTGVSIGEH